MPLGTCAKLLQSCLALCDPTGHSPPGSSVHRLLQVRILEWVAMPSSRGSSHPGIKPVSLMSPALAGRFLTSSTSWEALTMPLLFSYDCWESWVWWGLSVNPQEVIPFIIKRLNYDLIHTLHFKDGKLRVPKEKKGRGHCSHGQSLGPGSTLLTPAVTPGHLQSALLLEAALTSPDDQCIFKWVTPSVPFPASQEPVRSVFPAESVQNARAPGRSRVFHPLSEVTSKWLHRPGNGPGMLKWEKKRSHWPHKCLLSPSERSARGAMTAESG